MRLMSSWGRGGGIVGGGRRGGGKRGGMGGVVEGVYWGFGVLERSCRTWISKGLFSAHLQVGCIAPGYTASNLAFTGK